MPEILKIVVFSFVAYVALWIIAKLLGKKQIAQLSFIDYVVGITIGSIAAELTTETEKPFYYYLIAMFLFFFFDMFISFISRKGNIMKKIFIGKPLVVINDGKFDMESLKKSKLTVEEVLGMARDKGFFDISDIAYAIFETGGKLSILPKANQKPVVAEDLSITPEKPSLTSYVIVDGEIDEGSLSNLGKSKDWLLEKLGMSIKELKPILLAKYDEKEDDIMIYNKLD